MISHIYNILSGGKLSELEKLVNDLTSINSNLTNENKRLRDSQNENKELLEMYLEELRQASANIENKESMLARTQDEVNDLTLQLEASEKSLSSQRKEMSELVVKYAKQKEELTNANTIIQKMQQESADDQSVDEDFENNIEESGLSPNTESFTNGDSQITDNDLYDRIDVLESEKLIAIDEIKKVNKRYEDLSNKYSVLEANIEFYKKRISELENNEECKNDENSDKESHQELKLEEGNLQCVDGIESGIENAAQTLKIDKVIDVTTDSEIDAREFFQKPVDEIFHIRRELQDAIICNSPKYVCKYCGQMVKISGRNTERGRASFFSHLYDSDKCDLKTTTGLSRALINAKKYGEYGESQRHKRIKELIVNALADEASKKKGICDVQKEKTVFGLHPLFKWRRPDVYCRYNDKEIVFELQLSTTFASVIAERELFYKMNKIFLVWVFNFAENEEHVDLRNMMMKDIYFENHRNVFVIDREAYEEGLRRKELVLKCDWLESNGLWHHSGDNNYGTKGEFVTLSDLTYNTTTYKPYYHSLANPADSTNNNTDNDKALNNTLSLLDKEYERRKQQEANEELRVSKILAALDADSIDKKYKSLDVAIIKKNELYGLFNYKTNKEVLPTHYLSIKLWTNRKMFLVKDENHKYSLYNSLGKEILNKKYDSIPSIDDGVSIASYHDNGKKYYSLLVKDQSDIVEKNSYSFIEKSIDGNFIVIKEQDGCFLKGLCKANGYQSIAPNYQQLVYFSSKLYRAVKKGKHGIIDENEKIVLPFVYDRIDEIEGSKAKVVLGDSEGYIDLEGRPIFTKAIPLNSLPHIRIPQEKRLFMNKWWMFNCGEYPWKKGYNEVCHYQGKTIAFDDDSIKYFYNLKADKSCGIEGVLKEKTKNGLLFKVGKRIVKMNRRQLQRKPEGIIYEVGKCYNLYVSCIKEDLNIIYVSPIPCFGPTINNNKSRTQTYKRVSTRKCSM